MFDLSDSLSIVADTTYDETKRILTEYLALQRNMEFEVFVHRQEAQAFERISRKLKETLKIVVSTT